MTLPAWSLQQFTVVAAVLGALTFLVAQLLRRKQPHLEKILVKAFAASTIPTGFLLLVSGFQPNLLTQIADLSLYAAIAGIALLYISFKELFVE